jgi:hypothetical protein
VVEPNYKASDAAINLALLSGLIRVPHTDFSSILLFRSAFAELQLQIRPDLHASNLVSSMIHWLRIRKSDESSQLSLLSLSVMKHRD